LLSDDGQAISVRLNPSRARRLLGTDETDDVEWLTALVLDSALAAGLTVRDLVFDAEGPALRGLLTYEHEGSLHVIACAPEEAVEVSMRIDVPTYATDEALALTGDGTRSQQDRETLH
jgi:hypothetical protein